MAVPAFRFSAVRASVITLLFTDIPVYVFMAITAKLRLALLAEWLVAVTALVLVLRMSVHKFSGHHQRFNACCIEWFECCRYCCHHAENTGDYPVPHVVASAMSVQMNGVHMDDSRYQQHQEKWQVQDMPEGKQAFIKCEAGNPAQCFQVGAQPVAA